ncbi:precorrin-6y C5,15-methyltransferase (decarboxylating) subunit CbiE [Motilimonas sp. 1_MG-2023]|uniref:precorrin-6y C5,15-methyltransferase (decarboxylating) subunit CbiE n=1 Tax=Motilimonas sp. 1_MG-2023 TaxID=3062672 RepID=UPI0026E295B2|nr:precorrin-6y C5,15-methyltransferase (decarboxylating) subunit CbiE [Motilimonas sp. 1_MG-2023]MDO6526892.1 precorrin-6y C5,15-methyltransferase (decarboxylating) subunit CbiE [Motilimonas sp. 1_MG-2023]
MLVPINIIGLGASEQACLTPQAQQALQQATWVMGSARQIATVQSLLSLDSQSLELPKFNQLRAALDQLFSQARKDDQLVVLASGDALFYGIGSWFSRQYPPEQLTYFAGVSSIQLACHRLGLTEQDVDVLSLHGRPLAKLRSTIRAKQQLMILTDGQSQPLHLAQQCQALGFTQAQITVLEDLGYAQERIRQFSLEQLLDETVKTEFSSLHISFIATGEQRLATYLPSFPGIKDEAFITDKGPGKGMLTKREVRLAILSLLQPSHQDVIWDIGAGCGSVAIELSYWTPKAKVIAIEHHPARFDCLQQNRERFGVVTNLDTVFGRAPQVFTQTELAAPNKVFIGGSDGELATLLEQVWANLPEQGQLVVSAVMERTRCQCVEFFQLRDDAQDCSAETVQIAVNKGERLVGQLVYRPNLAVSLFSFIKVANPAPALTKDVNL